MAVRLTQEVAEGVVLPTSQKARLSQLVAEAIIFGENVVAAGPLPNIESVGPAPTVQSLGPAPTVQSVGSPLGGSATSSNPVDVRFCLFPVVALANSGQPVVLFNGRSSPYAVGDAHAFLVRHTNPYSVLGETQLFPYDTLVLGLVNWKGKLVAVAHDPASGELKVRTSSDDGLTWAAEATLIAGLSRTFLSGVTNVYPAFWMTTDRAGDTLYVFYYTLGTNAIIRRSTTSADPTQGWTAETAINFNTQIPGFNSTDATDEGKPYRSFVLVETLTLGTWALQTLDNAGTFGDRKGVWTGTLGGAWTLRLDLNQTGGVFAGAGGNGGIFLDRDNNLIAYVMSRDVATFDLRRGTADGVEWGGSQQEVPSSPTLSFGQGQGRWVPEYGKEVIWGHARADGTLRLLFVGGTVDTTVLFGGT